MIKNILFAGVLFFNFCLSAQNFVATYGFADVTTSSGLTDPSATPSVTGLTFGSFTAIGVSPNPNASGRFSFTNWPLGGVNGDDNYGNFAGALSATDYYQVSIDVTPGYTLNLSSLSFGVRRSGTGIRHYCVRSDLDNYTNSLAAATGTNTKLSVIPGNVFFWNYDSVSTSGDQKGSSIIFGNAFSSLTHSITFHFYAWCAEANGGSFSIDNVSFTGSVTDTLIVPDPVGLIPQDGREEISMYPNPVYRDRLFLERLKDVSKVEVISLLGTVVLARENNSKEDRMELDLSQLERGIYAIRTYSGGRITSGKIILAQD